MVIKSLVYIRNQDLEFCGSTCEHGGGPDKSSPKRRQQTIDNSAQKKAYHYSSLSHGNHFFHFQNNSEDLHQTAGGFVNAKGGVQSRATFRLVGEKVRRERRWTSAGATPARELVRSTR
jgi:hypothetical protein